MSDPSGAHAYHSMEMGPAGITSGASRLEGPHSFWEERELGSVVNLQLGSGYGGSTDRLDESGTEDHTQQLLALNDTHGTRKDDHKLGQLLATSISGNDITSSALYVVAVCAYYAGFWAPICLFLVSVVVLYLFRDIYAEVITALPVNGGTYTVLLNTSTKAVAGLAASLSLISYIATCVVSASVAVHYLGEVWSGINQSLGTCLLIIFFAVLSFCGVKDSARVACTIFIMHMCVMTILIIDCLDTAFRDNFNLLRENFNSRGEFANYPFAKVCKARGCKEYSHKERERGGVHQQLHFRRRFSLDFRRPCWASLALRPAPTTWKSKSRAYFPRRCATCGSVWACSTPPLPSWRFVPFLCLRSWAPRANPTTLCCRTWQARTGSRIWCLWMRFSCWRERC
eukprot:m.193478 g.193478  ORF g.193478 m.193478 type:complete len:399 (-) comp21766_c0_seq3:968-2164(-)